MSYCGFKMTSLFTWSETGGLLAAKCPVMVHNSFIGWWHEWQYVSIPPPKKKWSVLFLNQIKTAIYTGGKKIYGGHMSSAEIMSSTDFGVIQTKNNGPF